MAPPEQALNLFAQQASNRRKSRWLVLVFILFFAWLGLGGDLVAWQYTLPFPPGEYHHTFPWLGLALGLLGVGLVVNIRRTGAAKVLWSTGAKALEETKTEGARRLQNVAEEMAIAAGVPRPTIYLIDEPDPNAFVTGNDPLKSHLVVTTGLLELLDRDELQGVVAHEMGHIKNLDMQLMTLVAGLVGAVALIAGGLGRPRGGVVRVGQTNVWGGGERGGGWSGGGSGSSGSGESRGGKDGNPLAMILLVVWLASWLLAPLITRALAMGISRRREYLADAMAAQFTRNPMSLASALDKIEKSGAPTKSIKGGVAHLCIADPLGRSVTSKVGFFGDLLATHPPMALRVARLRSMAFQAGNSRGDLPPE